MPRADQTMETTGNKFNGASHRAFVRAQHVFPDGTSRATISRDPEPQYVASGQGAYVTDIDGRRYLDLNGNFTTLIHGHAFPPIVDAVCRAVASGSCFANPTESEIVLAELICGRVPGIEHIRFVNTGSEAVMFAIKAARAFTGRPAIAKVEGAYHGSYDWAEVSQAAGPSNWGSEEQPASLPRYRGMPDSVPDDVVMLRFNNAEGTARILDAHGPRLAAILIDPMPSRAGLIAPDPAFIAAIETAARRHGFLVIADEVLNFRQSIQGASAVHGITPDLFTLGKIIGGGFPIGAIGGRADVMAMFGADDGPPAVAQGGTFSANPVSMTAGHACMTALDAAAFAHLDRLGERLRAGLRGAIGKTGAPFSVTGAASLFCIHPKHMAPHEFREAWLSPAEAAASRGMTRFFHEHGVILPFNAAACLSTPMGETEIDSVIDIYERYLQTAPIQDSAS